MFLITVLETLMLKVNKLFMIFSKYNKLWTFLSKKDSIAFIFLSKREGKNTLLETVTKLDVTQQNDRLGGATLALPS